MSKLLELFESRKAWDGLWTVALLAAATLPSVAQSGRVSTGIRQRHASSGAAVASHFRAEDEAVNRTVPDFGMVSKGLVGLRTLTVSADPFNPIFAASVQNDDKSDTGKHFVVERSKTPACGDERTAAVFKGGDCILVIGFMPADDHTTVTATLTVTFVNKATKTFALSGTGGAAASCMPDRIFLPLTLGFKQGDLYPTLPQDVTEQMAKSIYHDFHDPIKAAIVNCFYATDNQFSDFTQFQSTYNAASGSTTLNVVLGAFNFINGMQVTLATNPQVGPTTSNSNAGSAAAAFRFSTMPISFAANAAAIPTISSTSSAQAAQNVLNGGTVFAMDLFPILFKQSSYTLFTLSSALKEGVDFQNFQNQSITATNPSTHSFVGLEGYFQATTTNLSSDSTGSAGFFFVGGSYGYSLMNHSYSIQNGFGGRVNSQLGQVSIGLLLKDNLKIAASRGFGPSQTFIDSTSMAQTTTNNFKSWSVALAYQKSSSNGN